MIYKTKEGEIRLQLCNHYTRKMMELSKREVSDIQIDIIKTVDSFCKKNDIQYCLAYGSLLGAVRHGGYIPWDDDVDIAMPRESYNRFLLQFSDDNYQLLSCESNTKYPFPFAKLCDNSSKLVEEMSLPSVEHGIDIDIFPIDNLPDNKALIILKYGLVRILRTIIDIKSIPIRKRKNKMKNYILWIGKALFCFLSANKISTLINKICSRDKKGSYMGIIVWGYGVRQAVQAAIFDEYTNILFEGVSLIVPTRYSEWLSSIYGDYMQLPSEENRITHHRRKAYKLEDEE